ncbi:hypothetical protein [Bradyrhizobium sp. AUGA SZCCT0431]|uniref:hypothetical protein n=1 Tax=Bradyrhizobium sp. AUGA SZCCT0431 TaxID=2807674 RepID=UPI001BAB01E7|nr:hypothetical protein [Bradyrhizobium sp. AUGA SZCCT0431]MBR1146488.1 hypothetical protein [Bradyrhizobium sp. AUGA SZCCT0431]
MKFVAALRRLLSRIARDFEKFVVARRESLARLQFLHFLSQLRALFCNAPPPFGEILLNGIPIIFVNDTPCASMHPGKDMQTTTEFSSRTGKSDFKPHGVGFEHKFGDIH